MTLTVKFVCALMGLVGALLTYLAAGMSSPAQDDAPSDYTPVIETYDECVYDYSLMTPAVVHSDRPANGWPSGFAVDDQRVQAGGERDDLSRIRHLESFEDWRAGLGRLSEKGDRLSRPTTRPDLRRTPHRPR